MKVDDAYRSSSHCFIRSLFSGVHGNGSVDGRGSGATRIGQAHVVVSGAGGALHPSCSERTSSMEGRSCWVTARSGLLVWLLVGSVESLGKGKLGDRTSRWSSVS